MVNFSSSNSGLSFTNTSQFSRHPLYLPFRSKGLPGIIAPFRSTAARGRGSRHTRSRESQPRKEVSPAMSHRRASDLSAAERAEILRHSEVGACLPEETLALLAGGSEAVDFRRRRFIYRRGDVADALYFVARGRVKVCSIDDVTG